MFLFCHFLFFLKKKTKFNPVLNQINIPDCFKLISNSRPVEINEAGFCGGFADHMKQTPVEKRMHAVSDEALREFLKPLNAELAAESQRLKNITWQEQRAKM
jgi:hypothetical protein